MLQIFTVLSLVFSPTSYANKDTGLADYCGRIQKSQAAVTVTLAGGERAYIVVSSERMSVEKLREEVPDGAAYCIRGWIDYDDPNRIILYDFFPL